MGGQQSKPPVTQDKVFEIPVQVEIPFSQDVIHHLSDSLGSTTTSPERQSTLDGHIRSRIAAELKRLRAEEEDVRHQIQAALEKENLDRETSLAGHGAAEGLESRLDGERKVTSSTILKGDLDEIQAKAEQYQARRTLDQLPGVQEKQKALIQCYRNNPKTTLECWREVTAFRKAIEDVEHQFVDSLR